MLPSSWLTMRKHSVQAEHFARPLQEKASRWSCPQSLQRARAKPWAKMPHSRHFCGSKNTQKWITQVDGIVSQE
jgi:hypothetical protein